MPVSEVAAGGAAAEERDPRAPTPTLSAPLGELHADRRLGALALLFALSGAASLMDQVVWLRYLGLVFGNTTYATATLLAVFLGGLGLGGWLGGRLARRLRTPLRAYALLEIAVALFTLFSPALFAAITRGYVALYRQGGMGGELFAGRAVLAALALLPPTILMGATLPLMLAAVAPAQRRVASAVATLYAGNTLGAVAGVALAGFVTIRAVGLYATLCLAAGLNLVVALGCVLLARPLAPAAPSPPAAPLAVPRRWLLFACFLMGATSLAYEVLWTRILVFHLGSSVFAFSLMLVLFLLGVGAGSLLARPLASRVPSPLVALALLQAGIGACALLQTWAFQHLQDLLAAILAGLSPQGFLGVTVAELLALLPVLLPPTLLMGASFPIAVMAVNREAREAAADTGAVYGANTLGNVTGALAGGFLLIPLLGTQNALLAVGIANLLLAATLWARQAGSVGGLPGRRRWAGLAGVLVPLVAMALLPADRVILASAPFSGDRPEDLVYFAEDASSSVAVRRVQGALGPYLSLELNGINVAGSSPELYAVQKMQGHLPLLLAADPQRVLHIGFGSGGTAHAVSRHAVGEIRIVEISPAVIRASGRFFRDLNFDVLRDPRVAVEINDGRNFLLASAQRFDAVLSDSIHPRYAGNGALYSYEYFALLRERLRPGGVASMWLPMYGLSPHNYLMILRAFQDVFPHVAVWYEPSSVNSFTVVTGTVDRPAWDAATLARGFGDPRVREELVDLGIHGPADLAACFLVGGEPLRRWLRRVPPHVDDLPAVEYDEAAMLERDWSWLETFEALLARRPTVPPAEYLAALPEEERRRARELFAQRRILLERHRTVLEDKLLAELAAPAGTGSEAP